MQAILVLQRMCTADMHLSVRRRGDLGRSGCVRSHRQWQPCPELKVLYRLFLLSIVARRPHDHSRLAHMQTTHCQRAPCAAPCRSLTTIRAPLALAQMASRAVSFTLRIQCRQCSSRLTDSCMADLLGASIPERGAASTLQELLLRSQPLPRSPLRHYSSSSCSEAAAMAAADSLLTPLESCKNGVHSSWHQVVRQRQVSSGQHGHHRLWCGQPPSGAASAASRRPLPRGKRCLRRGQTKT